MHFTGKQRDTETNLDDFPARYYSSTQGRWLSPDWDTKPVSVPYAILGNPQTLNLYSYVGGDPTNHADADGHEQFCSSSTCPTSADSSSEHKNQGSGQAEEKQATQESIARIVNDLNTLTKPVQPLAQELQKLPDVNPTVSGTGMGLTTTATFTNTGTEISQSVTPQAVSLSVGATANLDKSSSREVGTLEKELGPVSVSGTLVKSDANPNTHLGAVGVSFGVGYPPLKATPSTSLETFKNAVARAVTFIVEHPIVINHGP
jgi:RHS repeat-associated protein